MFVFILPLLFFTASADIVQWYDGPCGSSAFVDAGESCTISECVASTVAGGVPSRQGEFPHMVALRRKSNDELLCGGAIVNEEWVLTSAKCLQETIATSDDMDVTAGSTSLVEGGTRYDIANYIVHEAFDFTLDVPLDNDVALIKIAGTFDFSTPDVGPICAPDTGLSYTGDEMYFAGWGAPTGSLPSRENQYFTSMQVYSTSYCIQQFDEAPQVTLTERMVCAGGEGTDSGRNFCQGDRGGPLFYKDNGVFRVLGVGSYDRYCTDFYPTVSTDVSNVEIEGWITSKLSKN